MANTKITALTADTSPTSDDLIPTVTDPAGTPASRKVTLANAVTKAHGLSDGIVKVATGTMAVATANTDYATPNQDTTGKSAKTDALNSATTVVNVSSATAPTTGQALIATSSTAATWQTLAAGGDMVLASVQTVSGAKTFNANTLLDKGSEVFNVKAYGALGDGSTDDATNIQSAITAAQVSGGAVYFPVGTYIVGAALTITASNVVLCGAGMGSSIIKLKNATNANVITVSGTGTVGVEILDLTINGNKANQTTDGHGISINTPYSATDTMHLLRNIDVINAFKDGINIAGDTRVVRMFMVRSRYSGNNGFNLAGSDHQLFNAVADAAQYSGFALYCTNGSFNFCKAFFCDAAVSGYSGFRVEGVRNFFTGCDAQDNNEHGWRLLGCNGSTLSNCIGDSNGSNYSLAGSGLSIESTDTCSISGGTWFDRAAGAFPQSYGIVISGTSTGNIIVGETYSGNVTGTYSDTSSGTNYRGTTDKNTQTLTNKTLTSPVINTPTGITKTDIGLGNVTNNAQYYAGGTDVPITDGGTGASTKAGGFDALSPMTTAGDITYGGVSGTGTRLGIGTALQVLRTNAGATAPEWATVSSGGQTTYDAIVAPSGGDYTTLGAAITAASAGWRIFVKDGTYTETTITTSLANLVIEGESNLAVLSHTTAVLTFSGANVTIRNIRFSGTSGELVLSGAEFKLLDTRHNYTLSATTGNVFTSGAKGRVDGMYYTNTSSSNETGSYVHNTGATNRFSNIYIYANPRSTTASKGIFFTNGSDCNITNVTIEGLGAVRADGYAFINGGANSSIKGLILKSMTTTTAVSLCLVNQSGGTGSTYTGCTIHQGVISLTGAPVFTGNTIIPGTTANTVWTYAFTAGTVISGNKFIGNSTSGQVAIDLQSVNDHVVTGNYINSFPTGIQANGADCVITGNDFTGCTAGFTSAQDNPGIVMNNVGLKPSEQSDIIQATNTSGGALSIGQVVVWKAVASGNEITTTTTGGDDKVLGYLTNAPANNAVGKVKILGKGIYLKVNGTVAIAIGDPLTTYTTAGIAQKAAAGDMVFAYALEAYSTADSNGLIDCLMISPRLI